MKYFTTILLLFSYLNVFGQSEVGLYVDSVQNYQQAIKVTPKDGYTWEIKDFDLKEYMNHFNLLKCTRKDVPIICYYAPYPVLKPYLCVLKDESFSSLSEEEKMEYARNLNNRLFSYLIPKENSLLAYFQYLYFHEFGEMFALASPIAHRTEKRILTSSIEIKRLLKEDSIQRSMCLNDNSETEVFTWFEYNKTTVLKVLKKGVNPQIVMRDSDCLITLYEYSRYNGGLYKRVYKIQRSYPYKISLLEEIPIIKVFDAI